jgi:hypothetical protein
MSCNCNNCNITINAGGQPYIANTQVTVGTDTVNIALGWRRIQPIGYFTIRMENQIPSDATTALPITLTLNGITRPLLLPNGDPVTVATILNVSVMEIFNDKWNNILALMSRTIV